MAGLSKGGGRLPRSLDGDRAFAPSSQRPLAMGSSDPAMERLIASEIIPRLSEASRNGAGTHLVPLTDLGREEVETFAEMAGFGRAEDIDYFVANLPSVKSATRRSSTCWRQQPSGSDSFGSRMRSILPP